jgi:hypothetical protein
MSCVPLAESVFRQLVNTANAVRLNGGRSHAETDAIMREGIAAFFAEMAAETVDPARERARLIACIDRHFANIGLPRDEGGALFWPPRAATGSTGSPPQAA